MFYVEVLIDGKSCELELPPDSVYVKCPKCGRHISGLFPCFSFDVEPKIDDQFIMNICPNCKPAPPTPEERINNPLKTAIEGYRRKTGRTLTETQMLATLIKRISKDKVHPELYSTNPNLALVFAVDNLLDE